MLSIVYKQHTTVGRNLKAGEIEWTNELMVEWTNAQTDGFVVMEYHWIRLFKRAYIFFCFSLMLFAFADVELARWRRLWRRFRQMASSYLILCLQ